jgi:hypothetical protein
MPTISPPTSIFDFVSNHWGKCRTTKTNATEDGCHAIAGSHRSSFSPVTRSTALARMFCSRFPRWPRNTEWSLPSWTLQRLPRPSSCSPPRIRRPSTKTNLPVGTPRNPTKSSQTKPPPIRRACRVPFYYIMDRERDRESNCQPPRGKI